MKTFKGIFYGLALAIAVSAGAVTAVYNYFPPPGMTYTPTTGLVVGTATGGAQGTGTVNAQGLFVNGSSALTSASVPGSNTQVIYNNSGALGASSLLTFTSGSVLLNIGAATTPGTFSVGSLDSMVVNGVTVPIPGFALNSNIQGVFENHSYVNGVATGGARYYGVRSEGTISSPLIVSNGDHLSTFYAAGYNGSSYSLGGAILFQVAGTPGASAMPTDLLFQLSPTGSQTPATVMQLYHDAGVTVGSPTGGDQGAGTVNMQGCFVNGVACSTGGAAAGNPTGTVGLTAVNGVASTYMRSDAAPPLSQAISPTWTGTHLFNGALITSSATAGWSFGQSTGLALARIVDTTGTTGNKAWQINTNNTGTHLNFRVASDDFTTTVANWLDVTRSGAVVSDLSFGNATNNPTYTFLGNGRVTVGGAYGGGTTPLLGVNSASSNFYGFFDGTHEALFGTFTSGGFVGTFSNHEFDIRTNNTARVVVSNTGTVTVSAPSSGDALTVNGVANQNALTIQASSTTSQSAGVFLKGGTNSSDYAIVIENATASSTFFKVFGDGGITAGLPTGGDAGFGVINAAGDLRVNNVSACLSNGANCGPAGRVTLAWSGTCSGTGCITGVAKNASSVTRNSAGNYTVNESTSIGSSSVCTATTFGSVNSGLFMHISSVLSTTVNVLSVNSSGAQTDVLGFSIICMS